jgi:hypothetical protein
MTRRIMTEREFLLALNELLGIARRARISGECIIGYLFSSIVNEAKRAGREWPELLEILERCWNASRVKGASS